MYRQPGLVETWPKTPEDFKVLSIQAAVVRLLPNTEHGFAMLCGWIIKDGKKVDADTLRVMWDQWNGMSTGGEKRFLRLIESAAMVEALLLNGGFGYSSRRHDPKLIEMLDEKIAGHLTNPDRRVSRDAVRYLLIAAERSPAWRIIEKIKIPSMDRERLFEDIEGSARELAVMNDNNLEISRWISHNKKLLLGLIDANSNQSETTDPEGAKMSSGPKNGNDEKERGE